MSKGNELGDLLFCVFIDLDSFNTKIIFAFLGFATSSTLVDHEALSDVSKLWRYQARYHQHNVVVGQWSDILSIKAVSRH